MDIFPRGLTHGFDPKVSIFPTFFLCNIGQENVFYDIPERKKTPFQAIKKRSSKSRKIDIFPKGLTHGFGPKVAILSIFFQAIQARQMSFTIFQNEKKTPFQAIKTTSSKSRKIDIFPNGLISWFWFKNGHFSNFFLGNLGLENVFKPWFWSKNGHLSNFFVLRSIGH